MKALSIRQPWAWLICKGFKDIENRNWSTKFRGRIYVHAGATMDSSVASTLWILDRLSDEQREEYRTAVKTRGAIIGKVDIIACCHNNTGSPWFVGEYGFALENPVLYDKPIPYRGKQGFFEPEL